MKKNKGFTLIELLTVIAILAVILLIAAPTILGVLDKAKRSTFKNQVLMYVEGLKTQVALNEIGQEQSITWTNNEATVDFSSINMDSANNYTGKIKVTRDNGKYTYTVIDAHGDGYKLDSQLKPEEITVSNIIADDKKQVQEYTITNMVINGSFENGNENWECTSGTANSFDYFSVGNVTDEQSLLGKYSYKISPSPIESPYAYVYFKDNESNAYNLSLNKNHIYYASVNYLSPNSEIELTVNSTDWNTDDGILHYEIKNKSSVWNKSSIYFTSSRDKIVFIRVVNRNNKLDVDSYFDGVILVDLTETFGAGNEPTKEWCDKNIPYFDGTTKIYK